MNAEIMFFVCLESFPVQGLEIQSTPRHTFYVLAINLTPDLVIGSVIGEEDEGVEEVICAMLGWKDSHGPEGED